MNTIKVDFSKPQGKVKVYNAVNNGPIVSARGINNCESWKALKLPYARLHDASFSASYGGEWTVDVHRIFPDFNKDETNPENYVFGPTDKYIKELFEHGTEPYFRLGASIEHGYKKGTYPPADYKKWARICEQIIRHYTEGWADGFEYGIKYWEIWNEPDNYSSKTGLNPCWQSTPEEFVKFFNVACSYLMEKFPNLKIGGPALAYAPRDMTRIYLEGMKNAGVRPDFLSYHCYIKDIPDFVDYVRKTNELFAEYGFGDVETHLNEWNYIRGWGVEDFAHSAHAIKGIKGASFIAAAMCALHPEKLDMLMYYDARPCMFNGIFDTSFFEPLKGYYPFLAWADISDLGTAYATENDDSLYSIGASNGEDAAVLCTYFNEADEIEDKKVRLEIRGLPSPEDGKYRVELCPIDNEHDMNAISEHLFTVGNFDLILNMPAYTTYYIKIKKES